MLADDSGASGRPPFVVAAAAGRAGRRPGVGRALETAGRIGLPISLAAMFVALSALLWVPAADLGSAGDVVGWVVLAGAAIGVSQALLRAGQDLLRRSEAGATLRMTVDHTGITWSGAGTGALPWTRIRHVVLTARPEGGRRLLVTTGGPLAASVVTAPAPTQYVRRMLNPTRFALDICLDGLDRSPSTVFRAIHRASAGRFPDLYPAEQFRPDQDEDP